MSGFAALAARFVAGVVLCTTVAVGRASASTPAAPPSGVLTFGGPTTTVSYGGYAVGPLAGTVRLASAPGLPGQSQAVTLFCVDFLHSVTRGESFAVNVSAISTNPAALSLTRHADGLAGYRRAVWLADQFAVQPPAAWGGIQSAIWKIFGSGSFAGNSAPGPNAAADPRNELYWTAQANRFATSAAYASYDYGRYAVYTDASPNAAGSRQEFIGMRVVPEPGTVLLVGAGLAGVVGWGARRRRSGDDA